MSRGTALWFGPPDRPLLGWVHLPPGGEARGAVVLCPSIGQERSSGYFTLRRLAETLGEQGMVAVRFDYDGTGDSAGDEFDPQRVAAWIDSIGEAVRLARSAGAPSVSLVGLRIGALLAAVAAGRLGDIDSLVLWDPCPSGRAFVKGQHALHVLHFGSTPTRPGIELPGLVLSDETVEEFRNLRPRAVGEMTGAGKPGSPPRRALVLTRPGTTSGVELAEAIGVPRVERVDALEQSEWLDVEPRLLRLPQATIATIAQWLAGTLVSAPVPVAISGPTVAAVSSVAGEEVVEEVRWLGPQGLFAVVSSPGATGAGADAGAGADVKGVDWPPQPGPVLLLLTTSNEPHAGPSRLWVRLARQWAALGVSSVRFDLSGIGDSPARPGRAEYVVRSPAAFDDVMEAAAAVSPDDPSNVVLVGLCSGAYQALESALLLSPAGVCAVNPVIHFSPPETAEGPVDPRRRVCRPTTSAVRVYRKLPLAKFGRRFRAVAWRLRARLAGDGAPAVWMSEMVAGGVDLLCIGGEDETRPLLEGGRQALRSLLDSGRFQIEVIPGLDHALLDADQRDQVVRLLTEHVVNRFGGQTPREPGAERAAGMGSAGACELVDRRAVSE